MERIEKLKRLKKCTKFRDFNRFVNLAREVLVNDLLPNSLINEVKSEAPQLVCKLRRIHERRINILKEVIKLSYFTSSSIKENKLGRVVKKITKDINDLYNFETSLTMEIYYRENGVGD